MATLEQLIELLGPSVVRVGVAPAGAQIDVRDVFVHDPYDTVSYGQGDLVLGVGVLADAASIGPIVRAGPTAVIIKHDDAVGEVIAAAAAEHGVALLTVPRAASWGQLFVLLRSLLGEDHWVPAGEGGVASAHDLFAVANMVADWVSCPITIEDP